MDPAVNPLFNQHDNPQSSRRLSPVRIQVANLPANRLCNRQSNRQASLVQYQVLNQVGSRPDSPRCNQQDNQLDDQHNSLPIILLDNQRASQRDNQRASRRRNHLFNLHANRRLNLPEDRPGSLHHSLLSFPLNSRLSNHPFSLLSSQR